MNVSLTPRLEKFVKQLVDRGEYQSASEVVREGLRELTEKRAALERRRELLRREVEIGIESSKKGLSVGGKDFMKKLLKKARQQMKRDQLHKKKMKAS